MPKRKKLNETITEKKAINPQKKQMRFWTRGTISGTVSPERRRAKEPFPEDGVPVGFNAPNIEYHGHPLRFIGAIMIDDPNVAFKLMRYEQGVLQFDPRDALQWFSKKALESIGVTVDDHEVEDPEAPLTPMEPNVPLPNFYTMSPKERREWANAHGIFIDENLPPDKAAEHVKAEVARLAQEKPQPQSVVIRA